MTERLVKGHCGICPGNCGVEIVLQDERITKILPWKDHPEGTPCTRGRHAPEIIYSPDRIKTPLRRTGPKGTLEFEPISWDQAFDEIAGVVLKLKSEYGPACLASFLGRGNFEASMMHMFTGMFSPGNALFMPLGSPNAFGVSSLCFLSYGAFAPIATYGGPMSLLHPDLENADAILLWGANPATDSPLGQMVRLQAAKKRGAKILAIDPQRTASARLADSWIPIQPGTDGALMHGILRKCFKEGTIDREFGENHCEGFSELEEYVERFTPEYVEAVTRVPAKTLDELAGLLTGPKRVSFLTYTGLEYSDTGLQSIRALLTLFALTGNLDVKGGQRFQFPPPASLRKPNVTVPTDVQRIGADAHPFHCSLLPTAQFMEFPRSVLDADPYKIRFLWIGGASILTSFPNTDLFRRSLEALDFVVSVDRFLNADCQYADMVLPSTTYFEIASFCGYPFSSPVALQYRQRVIEPVGEAMNDYLICARLAERLGHGHLYPRDEDDMVEYVIADLPFSLGEFKERSSLGPISLDPETDKPSFAIRAEEKKWLSGALRPDGEPGFPTASGKWEIASSLLASFGHAALPRYEGLKEGPENQELVAEFPLTLTTGTRIQTTFRSQHLNIPGLLKRQPNAEALIHPRDAEPRRISTGDKVRITTPRGAVTFTARVTDDIMQGVVEANQGGGSPIQGEGWKNSNVNFLTDDQHRDPISGFPVFKALLCEVEKE